jgi:hypothetical protein
MKEGRSRKEGRKRTYVGRVKGGGREERQGK